MGSSTESTSQFIPPPPGEILGHPKALWMLFSAEFWERFCYYGMRAILVVYVAEMFYSQLEAAKAKEQASLIYGGYTALVYATGIFGGALADRYLGYQRAILLGGSLMALGMFLLLYPSFNMFLIGLSVLIVGNGMFKPNISTMVGQLYEPKDPRRDSGFTIFYMGINLGAFFAPLLCSTFIGAYFGAKYGFLAAGIGMIIGVIVFQSLRGMLGHVGKPKEQNAGMAPIGLVLLGSFLVVPIVYFLLSQEKILGPILLLAMLSLTAYFVYAGVKSGERMQLDRYVAMLILFYANVLFWALFEQAGSSLNFLAKDFCTTPLGLHFSVFQSFNAIFIVALAPLFAALWPWLDKFNLNPSIPRKFAIALIAVGAGFLVLVLSIQTLQPGQKMFWGVLGLTYLIHTIAELCLSPIGLSMVTKLATKKDVGLAMGGWFLSTACANYLAGVIASIASGGHGETAGTLTQYASVFNVLWWTNLVVGGIFFFASPLVNKLMHGVK